MSKKKCFVVMGFGEKVDYATGRTLNLDKTYKNIIQRAVEDAGLECIRADGIVHAGIIDVPMYELLFGADLVIADLSTSNPNAIYELGIRHALKPRTTIVIAEKQFKFPFDVHSLLVRQYEHLGTGIEFDEVNRMYTELKNAILTLIDDNAKTDSPIFTFLTNLVSASISATAAANATAAAPPLPVADNSFTALMDLFKDARKDSDWNSCIRLLNKLLEKRPGDVFLKQQLALATYKSKSPSVEGALNRAKDILLGLNPEQTTDPETLGLWGAVHKRFWEVKNIKEDLDKAIWAYEKGFYLKNDYYNGINYAYLLNVRASLSEKKDAIADAVIAGRTRKKVIAICNDVLSKEVKDESGNTDKEQKFWTQATLAEAYVGTGERAKADQLIQEITPTVPEEWMLDTMKDQLYKLKVLLKTVPECN